jgi:multidrug resistance protein
MSPLVIVFVTVFIDLLGFGIIIPLMPFYATHFGASAFEVGMLATSFSLMQFLFAPLWGRWSDVIGRRPVILIGLLGSAVSYLTFGLAQSLVLLFVSRCLAGVAGANISTAQAFIADSTAPENRAKGMGMVGAAFGLGFIFGPALGGFLSQWGYQAPAFFAAALSFANFIAALAFLPESLPADRRTIARRRTRLQAFEHALNRPRLPTVLVVFFLIVSAFASFESMFALYSQARFGFTSVTIGYLFAGVGVVLAVVQGLLVGRVVKRVGEHRLAPAAIALLSVGLGLVSIAPSVPALAAACGIIALGMGFQSPSMLSVISQLSDRADQGSALGVSQSLGSLARIVGPLWGGFVFDRFGHAAPFISAALLMSVACALSVAAFRGYTPTGRVVVGDGPQLEL